MKKNFKTLCGVLLLLLLLCLSLIACDVTANDGQNETTDATSVTAGIASTGPDSPSATTPSSNQTTAFTGGVSATETTATTTSTTASGTSATTATSATTQGTTASTAATTAPIVSPPPVTDGFDLSLIPSFSSEPFYHVNNGTPFFTPEEITAEAYEFYDDLDGLGRCTLAMACLGRELMPTDDRGSISHVDPTGWHSVIYSNVSGGYLYNRCHLIGWQLTGENANRENLITGTKYLNVEGMLPFENMIADYIKETNNHVMYRVTPIFEGNNLLCTGVLLEAYSVEDQGEGIQFNVFCYNSQPGIDIDYSTGASQQAPDVNNPNTPPPLENATYIINTNTKRIHSITSKYAGNLTSNMEYTTKSMEELLAEGYTACKTCDPT